MNNTNSGARIEDLLKRKGWKKNKFASYLGISVSTLSRILSEKQPLSERLASKMAEALNVSVNYILCSSEDLTPPGTKEYSISKEMLDANKQQLIFSSIEGHLKLLGLEFNWHAELDGKAYFFENNAWFSEEDVKQKRDMEFNPRYPWECEPVDYDEYTFENLVRKASKSNVWVDIVYKDKHTELDYVNYQKWLKSFILESEIIIQRTFGIGIDVVEDNMSRALQGKEEIKPW